MPTLFIFLAWFAILMMLASIPASIAAKKGRSYGAFYVAAVIAWPIALIVALLIGTDHATAGDIVELQRKIETDDGVKMATGYTSTVREVKVIDGKAVVLLDRPDGGTLWVNRRSVRKA